MLWNYLQLPVLQTRQRIAAQLLFECQRILEIGAYKSPITNYLLHNPEELIIVDPLIEPFETDHRNGRQCRIRHVPIPLDQFDATDWTRRPFGLIFCGMDLERNDSEPDVWLKTVCKFLWLVSLASPCILEYPVNWSPSARLFELILSLLQPRLAVDIRLDFTRYFRPGEISDEIRGRLQRRMVALADMESVSSPQLLIEAAARILFGPEAAPLVLGTAVNNFVETAGGLSLSSFKDSGNGSRISLADGVLNVATPEAAWSFAALLTLSPNLNATVNGSAARPALVEIEVSVDHGEIGVGMLHENYSEIAGERLINASPDRQRVKIFVPDLRSHLGLILRNGRLDHCVSSARVFAVTLHLAT